MPNLARARDRGAENLANGLVAQTYPQKRNTAGNMPNRRQANTRFVRRTRPRRDNNPGRGQGVYVVQTELIISHNMNLLAQLSEVAGKVVGK